MCVCVCVCVCVFARARGCVCVCARARACVRSHIQSFHLSIVFLSPSLLYPRYFMTPLNSAADSSARALLTGG